MTNPVTLFVPGAPAPQGSKRHVGGGRMIESSRHLHPWRAKIAQHATSLEARQLAGPVDVSLVFVMPRPISTPKRAATPPAVKRPDVDKLARAVLDALTGVCWADDSQVVDLRARKRLAELGEQPGVEIVAAESERP